MMAWIDGLPLLWSIGFFWMLAILRTLIVFSLGRGLASGVERTRWFARVMEGPVYVRAQRFIQRHGVWAIPFCYLTVGIQTAVIGSAGVARMPWRRFLPAAALGTFLWGVMYGTVGMAVVWAVIGAALGEGRGVLALVLILAAVAASATGPATSRNCGVPVLMPARNATDGCAPSSTAAPCWWRPPAAPARARQRAQNPSRAGCPPARQER